MRECVSSFVFLVALVVFITLIKDNKIHYYIYKKFNIFPCNKLNIVIKMQMIIESRKTVITYLLASISGAALFGAYLIKNVGKPDERNILIVLVLIGVWILSHLWLLAGEMSFIQNAPIYHFNYDDYITSPVDFVLSRILIPFIFYIVSLGLILLTATTEFFSPLFALLFCSFYLAYLLLEYYDFFKLKTFKHEIFPSIGYIENNRNVGNKKHFINKIKKLVIVVLLPVVIALLIFFDALHMNGTYVSNPPEITAKKVSFPEMENLREVMR